MADLTAAIIIHVLALVWWIGGLAFVTAVFLPAMRRGQVGEAHATFRAIERRFEPQARIAVLLVGLSGVYMVLRLHLWSWFFIGRFWWLDAMAAYWLLFIFLLFVLGPAGLLERMMRRAGDDSRVWLRMQRVHSILLAIGLAIVAGAVAGSHGL